MGRSATFPDGFRDQAGCGPTHLLEEGAQPSARGKELLEPAVCARLEIANELKKTHLPVLSGPERDPQGRTERVGQHDEEQTSVEIAEGRSFRFGGQRGQMQITFPGLEHEFHLPP